MSEEKDHTLSTISIIFGILCFIFGDMPMRTCTLGICAILVGAIATYKHDDRGYIGFVLGFACTLYAGFFLIRGLLGP